MNKKNKFGFNYSYSSVSTFNHCPLQFKLRYIDKKPILQNEALIKGNLVHDMAEKLMNDISENKEITINLMNFKHRKELVNFLELESLRLKKYTNKDDYFVNTCEQKIVDNDIITVGKLDRIYEFWDVNKGKVLLDYKTGKVRPKEYYYPQLSLYTYMYNKKHPEDPIKYWEIDWLSESKQYFLEPINQKIIDEEVRKYKLAIEEIEKTTTFEPNLSPLCMWCGVLPVCPMQKQALKRFKRVADRKGLDVMRLIEEYHKTFNKSTKKYEFHSKIAGTSFNEIDKLDISEGDELKLVREPNNKFDKNAIIVMWNMYKLGYIRKELAKDMAVAMDKGRVYKCFVSNITGGTKDKENKGVNILIKFEVALKHDKER